MRLGGTTELADELGISRQRVSQVRRTPGFPEPVGQIAAGQIWDLDEVQRWNSSGLRRGAGRPASGARVVLGERYLLDEVPIGSGGFADVYRAEDLRASRRDRNAVVAVKVLRELTDIEVRRRFSRELRLIAECSHPNIVPILAHGETGLEQPWYAMPLAKGSLADEADTFVGNDDSVLKLMRQLCDALGYVHSKGIFHRDIKPGNILRIGASTWALADFGLAREADRTTTALTSTLQGVGTLFFAAPEAWRGAKYAEAPADVFSLGKVLQQLATGELPVDGVKVEGRYRSVILKATRPRPEQRYSSAGEMCAAIESALSAPSRWASSEAELELLGDRLQSDVPDPSAVMQLMLLVGAAREPGELLGPDVLKVVTSTSSEALSQIWESDPDGYRDLVADYVAGIEVVGWPFAYCDKIANLLERAVLVSDDAMVLSEALRGLMVVGHRHNRFYVRDVATGILQRATETDAALAAADAIRSSPTAAVQWTLTRFVLRSLHPTIRDVVSSLGL